MEPAPSLRAALQTVTGARPTRVAVRVVVDRCHRLARAYLRQKQKSQSLREDVLGEDVDDLALDAIAGLFERDERGRFPELVRYFSEYDLSAMDEPEVEEALRRLVFGTVTDWLFEAYQTADRSLSNLRRALRRALGQRDDAHLQERGGRKWIEIESPDADRTEGEKTAQQRPMPLDTLEAYLTGAVAEAPTTGALLDRALTVLRDHPDYESAYPLTRLAQVMRAARVRVLAVSEHDSPVRYPESPFLRTEEIQDAIEHVLTTLREEKRSTYVDAEKLEEGTYRAYFRALRDRLEARFVPPGDDDMTHFDALSSHLPDLSREEYRDEHRSRFEYLEQSAREALVEQLRELV